MTEDQKKILAWRRERVNKKGFKSQAAYDEAVSIKNDIQVGVLCGEFPSIDCVVIELSYRLGFGPDRAKVLAKKWWEQRERLLSVPAPMFPAIAETLGVPPAVIHAIAVH